MSSLTVHRLESRFDRRIHEQFFKINEGMQSLKEDSDEVIRNIFNSLIRSIISNYEIIKNKEIDIKTQKNLKKMFYEEIHLIKKLNKQEIENIDVKIKELSLRVFFNLTFNLDGSLFIKIFEFVYRSEKPNEIDYIKEISDKIKFHQEIESIIDGIEKNTEELILNKQNDNSKLEMWKPKKTTQEFFINRIESMYYKNKNLNEFININLIRETTYRTISDLDFDFSGLVKINEYFDLIKTSKNNHYLVIKSAPLIGEGAFKKIHYCLNLSKGEVVAAAYLKKNQNQARVFNEEVTYLKLKGTHGIIKIKDCFVSENKSISKCIFIYDWYARGTLYKDLKNEEDSKVKKNKVLFCKMLIDILDSAIQRKIILCDFKPENILLDNTAIDDFTPPILADLDIQGLTYSYCAPEVLKQRTSPYEFNEKSLVWSLGAVFYEIYCGPLFEQICSKNGVKTPTAYLAFKYASEINNEDIEQLIINHVKHMQNDFPFLEIIQSMLTKNPGERLTLSEVKVKWEQAMQYCVHHYAKCE